MVHLKNLPKAEASIGQKARSLHSTVDHWACYILLLLTKAPSLGCLSLHKKEPTLSDLTDARRNSLELQPRLKGRINST